MKSSTRVYRATHFGYQKSSDETLVPDRSVSIIIPCYLLPDNDNALLRHTGNCIRSVRDYFTVDYELVLVDNGSVVGVDYLKAEADIYIRNDENRGYAPAVNQGLRAATGFWLLVANNDVVFFSDWARAAIDYWLDSKNVGAISALPAKENKGKPVFVKRPWNQFFGALWLVNQEIVSIVGLLDESFEYGYFEDWDYARRIEEQGFDLIKGGWVQHVGNATSGKMKNLNQFFMTNKRRFGEKWQFRQKNYHHFR